MIVHQLQKWTQHVRDLTFAQLHVPLMAAFDSDHFVTEAIRPGGFGARLTPGQVPQRCLGTSGIGSGELGSVENGVQGNPGEAAAASHIYAHGPQCAARSVTTLFVTAEP